MLAEGGKVEDGSDLFCVSAPRRGRLRVIASSAAQMHLAVLVRKARSAAVGAESFASAAMMSLSAAAVVGQGATSASGAVMREEGDEAEHGGSGGSDSSGSEDARDNRFASFASEAAW